MAIIAFTYAAFTNFAEELRIKNLPADCLSGRHQERNQIMAATGELIRLINYVDDINTTMRRIHASLYGMDAEERKKLAESLRAADGKLRELLTEVEK